jgi:hypothetical protein
MIYIDSQVCGYRLFVVLAAPLKGYLSCDGKLFSNYIKFRNYNGSPMGDKSIPFEQVFCRI